ncbi:MAG: hypothetical protein HYT12_03965 [Candidatus Liptonbacteria bacterium]|nr:hypothetical protein [Candidatus Liptonbacteria bacterium]
MKAKLIEYDYTYQDWDTRRGTREKSASNRAILFFNNENRPVAVAIPKNGKLEIKQVSLRNGRLCSPVLSNKYMILKHETVPFQHYRVIKSLALPSEQLDLLMHAVICCMKMDDLRNNLLESIRAESRGFDYRI